jgi:hypothetical protein
MTMERAERTSSIGPTGVMAMACRHRRPDATRETPAVILIRINWQLVRDRLGRMRVNIALPIEENLGRNIAGC